MLVSVVVSLCLAISEVAYRLSGSGICCQMWTIGFVNLIQSCNYFAEVFHCLSDVILSIC